MKLLVCVLALLSFSAFADYKSEYDAIGKFWTAEFANAKNYAPAKNGALPTDMLKSFYDKLMKEEKSRRYYLVCLVNSRIRKQYQSDRAFAVFLESKFNGKKLSKDQLDKVAETSGNFILKDSNTLQKEALKNSATVNKYYDRVVAEVAKASF
jgi:hypothetical protein